MLTHLHLDHAGGVADFPEATVHVYDAEYRAAVLGEVFVRGIRYNTQFWDHGPRWSVASLGGDRWFGFDAVRAVPGLDDAILLVPIGGHTPGHCAVAVEAESGWILHCGDAYFHRREMDLDDPRCPPGLAFFQAVTRTDRCQQRESQEKLRALKRAHGDAVRLVSAHDPEELRALQA